MGGGASKKKAPEPPPPPPPKVEEKPKPKTPEKPKPPPPAEKPPAQDEGIFGSARELNTLLLGGEDSVYQHSYTVELDRRQFIKYLTEPKAFRMPDLSKDPDTEEEEETAFQAPLDPRDVILRQSHEPPGIGRRNNVVAGARSLQDAKSKTAAQSKKKRKRPQGWRPTTQRVTFKPEAALLPSGNYYLAPDAQYTKQYEQWGLDLDLGKFPLQVNKVVSGSVADEHAARHPQEVIEPGDFLIEIDDMPVCPNAGVYQLRRKQGMTAREIREEDDMAKMTEARLRARDEAARKRMLADAPAENTAEPNAEEAGSPADAAAKGQDLGEVPPDHSHSAAVVEASSKSGKRGSLLLNAGSSHWHGYELSSVSRMGPSSNRFAYWNREADAVKPIDNLAFDCEEVYNRLDVVNKELFDVYYHAPTVKLRFLRMQLPQFDEGQGFMYTLNLCRARQKPGMQKTAWGIVFHLDWEEVPREEQMGETFYTQTSADSYDDTASVLESESDAGGAGLNRMLAGANVLDQSTLSANLVPFSQGQSREGNSQSREIFGGSGILSRDGNHYAEPPDTGGGGGSAATNTRRESSTRGTNASRHSSLDEEEEDEDPDDGIPPPNYQVRYSNPLSASLGNTRRSGLEEEASEHDVLNESARPGDSRGNTGKRVIEQVPLQQNYSLEEEPRSIRDEIGYTFSSSSAQDSSQALPPASRPRQTTNANVNRRHVRSVREEEEEEDRLLLSQVPQQPFPDSLLGLHTVSQTVEGAVDQGESGGGRGESGTLSGTFLGGETRTSSSSSQQVLYQQPRAEEAEAVSSAPAFPPAEDLVMREVAEGFGFGRNLRMRRVIKVQAIENGTVASKWNDEDSDVRIMPGDKVMRIQGVDVTSIPWDFLLLPPYPDEDEFRADSEQLELAQQHERKKAEREAELAAMGGSPLSRHRRQAEREATVVIEEVKTGPQGDKFREKMEKWKNQVLEQFRQHRVLSTLFELVIEVTDGGEEVVTKKGRKNGVYDLRRKRKFRTYLKCKPNYFPRDLDLELELYRYDPEAAIRKQTKTHMRSPRRILDFMETAEGEPLRKTQSPQSPMHRPSRPGSPEAGKELALKEMEEGVYNYEAPPALEMPTSLVKSRFKVFLSRSAVDLPWGIYLDERFATLNVYICQELEEQPEAPVCQWNEYVSEQGAFGCQLQTGDLVLSFNDKSVWAEAEKEIQHGLRLVLECYRPPYKPCPMTSPPFLQTNERLLDVCWARSRFLTTVYDDEEALANTPDGGLRDTHYAVVLHSLSPDRWYMVDGASREAKDISAVCTAIPAPLLNISVVNLPSLRSYEAYVAIRNSQGWSPFSKVSNRERLEKFIQLKITQKKNDGIAAQIRYVCTVAGDERVPMYAEPDLSRQPLPKESVPAGQVVEGTDLRNGWLQLEKSKGGLLWQRFVRAESFLLEKELYKREKLLVLCPTSFESLEGRYPTDAPRSLEAQPLPISLAGLDKQLVQEHYKSMQEWREYYKKIERDKVEAANAARVAELLGAAEEQKRLEDERAHRQASADFFRVSKVLEQVEDGVPKETREMFKKRVDTSEQAKLDNVTTYKAVLVRKMPEEDWGLKFDPRLEQAGQKVVRHVILDYKIPNVVTRWNRLQTERRTPYLEVRVGDRLLSVNAKTNIYAMDEQFAKARELRCEFCRTGDARRALPDRKHKDDANEKLMAAAQFDKDVNTFNSEAMREPHRVMFKSHEPLGFAIDWRSGFPLKVKYVAKGSLALKLGVQENDIIFAINGQEVLKRHFSQGADLCRKMVEPALRERPLEMVFHRAIRFEILKHYPPRAKQQIRMLVPEGIRLGFTFDVDQMPPPVRHVKPFSRAMKTHVHIADALVAVNNQKVASYMLESYTGLTGGGHTILDQLLAERPLELLFERGHYEPPYPEHFLITDCGFAYDPDLVVSFVLQGLVPESFRYEYNPIKDILPSLMNPLPKFLERKGLSVGDYILGVDDKLFYDFDDHEHDFPQTLYSPESKKIKFLLRDEGTLLKIGALKLQTQWRGHNVRKNVFADLKAKAIEEKFTKMMMSKIANVVRTEEDEQALKERLVVRIQKAWRRRKMIADAKQKARVRELEKSIAGNAGLMVDEFGELVPVPVSPTTKNVFKKKGFSQKPTVEKLPSEGFSTSGTSDGDSNHIVPFGSVPAAGLQNAKGSTVFASYFVQTSRAEGQKWGIAFDIDRGVLINVVAGGAFSEWKENKVSVGDVIYSVNGVFEPRKFYEILAAARDVRVEFRRLRSEDNRAPFEALITKKIENEKWGIVLDMGTGDIAKINSVGPCERYNAEVRRVTGTNLATLQPGDKVLAVNRVPLGGSDESIFDGMEMILFVLPRGFDRLLPSRSLAL